MTTFSTPDLPSSGNVLPPVLLSAIPTGVADSMHIALNFSTAMAAGSGTITDGATDTHTLSAAQAVIDGSHVTLNVAGLLPGHSYSILMGAGVLVSSGHLAFGGVPSTSQVQFSTPAAPDTTAPSVLAVGAGAACLPPTAA